MGLMEEISIEDYAKGNGIENNWMTRYLVNQMEGELTKEHLEQAKVVLQRKFLVGFLDDLEESLARFIKYANWHFMDDEVRRMNQQHCMDLLVESGTNRNERGYD